MNPLCRARYTITLADWWKAQRLGIAVTLHKPGCRCAVKR